MVKAIFDIEEWKYFTNHERTPLQLASREGYLDIVKCLVEKGADLNAKDNI